MRAGDRLSEERRALPWVRVEKAYVFDTPEGQKTLADLFDGRSQPNWPRHQDEYVDEQRLSDAA